MISKPLSDYQAWEGYPQVRKSGTVICVVKVNKLGNIKGYPSTKATTRRLSHTQRSQRAGYMLLGKKETARVESPHVLSMERA
jgi:hypothetical protein